MKRYDVLKRINHNKKIHEVGGKIDLTDEYAAMLLQYQAIANGVPIPDPENTEAIYYEEGETLSFPSIVYLDENERVYAASNSNLEQARSTIGIAVAKETEGVKVISEGFVSHTGWNWTRGKPLFLGSNGQIIQGYPASGHVLPLGESIDSDSINLNIQEVEVN